MTPPFPGAATGRRSAASAAPRTDHWRGPPAGSAQGDWKEWHHFVVHAPGLHLLVNFSLVDDLHDAGRATQAYRAILLARTDAWRGDAVRVPPSEVRLEPGTLEARLGPHQMGWDGEAYVVRADLPEHGLRVDLRLTPAAVPVYSTQQTLSAERTLSWFFLARLAATGTVEVGTQTFTLLQAPAYHDHNWGSFRWGDDFCWEWASALPTTLDQPWSTVLMRLTDRARTRVRAQGLFLFHHGEPLRFFRDAEVHLELEGRRTFARPLRIPRVMGLLAGGRAGDVPARVRVVGRAGADELTLTYEPEDLCQVVVPNETDAHTVTLLDETTGSARVEGRVRGLDVASEGPGVFEFLRA